MILQIFSLPFLAGIASAINLKVSSTGGNASSPLMYGLMFEDINHSGDGGIYAELINNRAFQGSRAFPSTLEPWVPVGNAVFALQNTSIPLSSALPTSINVAPGPLSSHAKIGLLNPGWWGIDVKPQKYTGSFWALGSYKGDFTVKLQSNLTDDVFASVEIPSSCQPGKWVEHKFELEPNLAASNINNTFVIEFEPGSGAVNFNLISLFPPTYKNRPNGNRPELMEALKALNPSFIRMPGGNNMSNETIGPLTQRPGRPGTWGYGNTDGLGLVEYLNWCTDLEVEPLLAVWAGMYLGSDADHILSAEALAPWVDDTLNELEFILGPVSTPYGALRASLGYPEPWALKYVEIGNEDNLYTNGSSTYAAYRFSMFYDAITAAYPNLKIISSTGDYTAVGGSGETATWTDFHTYSRPDTLVSMFDKFDHASREYKTLIGEYAIVQENLDGQLAGVNWDLPKFPQPVWIGAVSEAIWSIGAERNSDAVVGMSYAPGFQNLNSYNWSPDLISFTADVSQTVLSTSWHVINLFSNSRYTSTVPITSDSPLGPAYWVAGTSGEGKYTFKIAIYNATSSVPFNITFEGVAKGASGRLTVLSAPEGLSANMLDGEGVPTEVVAKREVELVAGSAGEFGFELENWEVAVFTT
ncbi:glycoside hydrolase family 51 protein [Hyaloscypha bicolor E]|uniref:non-reducing end alpha-L-arabinofuranosidase n=1 Tax=Hyaloscypha bicolor E TaxID=1095630 RepID=A0A2J6TAG2_9HELO|nr:glycoside hydrolase family 51 protein [Hyaloscypha bicolor E]PMD60017.1 glycoside hydrolase family 51 protein [Hyaloscypha bicolor E]